MCLINIAWQHHPDFPLIILANRDEFHERPTRSLHRWESSIYGGQDLQEGGMWMGISETGHFAAITNYRDPYALLSSAPSRGELVRNYLENVRNPEAMQDYLMEHGARYNGFNLFYGDQEELRYFNNVEMTGKKLQSGIYGLSNALLDTPWPKLKKSKVGFKKYIQGAFSPEKLQQLFSDKELAHPAELPSTGVPLALERQLSAICISTEGYGTRSTALIYVDKDRYTNYFEWGVIPEGDTRLTFRIT